MWVAASMGGRARPAAAPQPKQKDPRVRAEGEHSEQHTSPATQPRGRRDSGAGLKERANDGLVGLLQKEIKLHLDKSRGIPYFLKAIVSTYKNTARLKACAHTDTRHTCVLFSFVKCGCTKWRSNGNTENNYKFNSSTAYPLMKKRS